MTISIVTLAPDWLKYKSNNKVPRLLRDHRWILYHNPKLGRKKEISFLSGGQVGAGRNEYETTWTFSDNELIIHRQNGDLQNRFQYDKSLKRFVCTGDLNAKGLDDQYIQMADE